MSQDDQPQGERTILVPRPGRRTATPAASRERVAAEAPAAALPLPDAPPPAPKGGVNPLVAAANALLDLVVPLRIMVSHPDVEGLRAQVVAAIRRFEQEARGAGYGHETCAVARYALCTFLDETISSTPWGGSGVWASRSLLVAFHNEAFGGEKFFLLLQKLSQDAKANLHVLELMYLCLALGLEGRYRVIDNGRAQLETLRERLQQLIRKERGALEHGLSPHWLPTGTRRPGLGRYVPLWLIAMAALLVLVLIQLVLAFLLNRHSDPVYASLQRIRMAGPAPAAPPAVPTVRIARFLAPEIERGLVSVTETPERSTVVLHGDGVFGSGSADVVSSYDGLLARIGDAVRAVPGRVIVIGHTDDVPSNSARWPSNWALSKARAATVVRLLAARTGTPDRYTVEGRGETEPLMPNDTPANRARNRRVVIIVLTPAQPT